MARPKLASASRRPRVPRQRAPAPPATTLIVIDDAPLREAAWTEFQAVRRRLEKATHALHRHEEIDVPAYDAWVHRTFPLQISALREIQREVFEKTRRVQEVQARAAHTGRSVKRLWQEENERRADPGGARARRGGDTEDEPSGTARRRQARLEDFFPAPAPRASVPARDIYRRLVQRLHPDRGGEWTVARQQLWHEVQQAWAAGDVDWLARLEMEWETAHDVLGRDSPLGRLRAAIEELHAARRDLEHKFAAYRASPAWQFTQTESERDDLQQRVEASLGRDYRALRRQLRDLDATIELWEEDWTRPQPRGSRSRRDPPPYPEAFRPRRRSAGKPGPAAPS